MKKMLTLILITILSLLLICCSKKTNENGYKYIGDLEYLDSSLKLHPNSFINDELSQEDFDNKISCLKDDINNKDMSDFDINYRIAEIFSMAKDGHASYFDSQELLEKDNYFPFSGQYFGKGYYIVSCIEDIKDREDFLGSKLISINNISMKEIEERYDMIISNDNSQWLKHEITLYPFRESAFKYLNILKKKNIFKCELSDGSTKEFELSPICYNDAFEALQDEKNNIYIDKDSLIQFQKPDNMSNSCWYKIDSKNKSLYLYYGTCMDEYDMLCKEPQSDVNFKEFCKNLTSFINNSNSEFDKVIIDLRGNTGGRFDYFDDIINNNLSILSTKKVYALIGKKTFSAGTVAANTAAEKCNATLIGEETGGAKVLHSMAPLTLSGTKNRVSIPLNITIDNKIAGRNCTSDKDGLIPDIFPEHSINNLINGIDEDYEAAIND